MKHPLPIGLQSRSNLRRGRRCIDACGATEDLRRSTARRKRTSGSKFQALRCGLRENYDLSERILGPSQ
jgi:hypothetical protein